MVREEFCSAYGKGEASLFVDTNGREFVLRTFLEGHGTRNTVSYLRIDELMEVRCTIAGAY